MDTALEEKYEALIAHLSGMGSALLAFSGGVDSSMLLAAGKKALGSEILAATVHSPLHPASQLKVAADIASHLGVEHITIDVDELTDAEFVANPPERCYVCKRGRYGKLVDIAAREGIAEVIDGSQLDDTGDYRPGMDAAGELGIATPLLDLGFVKLEVREVAREMGLPNWNAPAGTCLATRVPYDQEITREKLGVIEEGEKFLSGLGLSGVRLRYIDRQTARIEVNTTSLPLLVSEAVRERVLARLRGMGFVYVTADLAGFRSGALNEALEGR